MNLTGQAAVRGCLHWGPAVLWAAVLFLLSSAPDLPGPSWVPYGDKVAHLGLYGILGGSLAWGRESSGGRVPHALLILLGVLYGLSDEWHQSFVPGRTPSLGDLAADGAGVLLGYAAGFSFLTRRSAEGRGPLRPRPPLTR